MKAIFQRIVFGIIEPSRSLPIMTTPCGLRKVVGSDELLLPKHNSK